jgi:hypothetical protein
LPARPLNFIDLAQLSPVFPAGAGGCASVCISGQAGQPDRPVYTGQSVTLHTIVGSN